MDEKAERVQGVHHLFCGSEKAVPIPHMERVYLSCILKTGERSHLGPERGGILETGQDNTHLLGACCVQGDCTRGWGDKPAQGWAGPGLPTPSASRLPASSRSAPSWPPASPSLISGFSPSQLP